METTPREHKRIEYAGQLLEGVLAADPAVRGGVPCLKGTRFPVSRVLAELSDGHSLPYIAEDYDLDGDQLRDLLMGLSIYLDAPLPKAIPIPQAKVKTKPCDCLGAFQADPGVGCPHCGGVGREATDG